MMWKRNLMMAGLALATTVGIANAQAPAQPVAAQPAGEARPIADQPPGELPGPIDSLDDLQDTGKMFFKMSDTNNDGQISQKEAIDAGNLMVGGFFFRADANGDGTLSQDEAKQARDALLAQKPLLRYVSQQAKAQRAAAGADGAGTTPAQAIGNLLDANNDKQLQATEVRQAVQTTVQGLFAAADTNRDGQMSPTEINAGIVGAVRAAAQASFQQADTDRNGAISHEEFSKGIIEPANMVFGILDADNDNQISAQEADQVRRVIGSQLRGLMVPEPANSPRNLIRTGASPDQVAPVPSLPAQPVTPRVAPAGRPAPPATPRP